MRALDEAIFAALEAVPALRGAVYYGSPLRDTKPGFVSYFAHPGRPSTIGGFRSDAREYEYEVIAADRDGERAEALIEAAEDALVDWQLPVAGWGTTQTITWQGDVPDLGDLVVDGTIIHFAGRFVRITVQRPRQLRAAS